MKCQLPAFKIVFLCLAWWLPLVLSAQVFDPSDIRPDPTDPDFDVNESRRPGPQQQRAERPDTFGIFAFQVGNPNEETPFSDSLLAGWEKYEPDQKVPFDYGTVGILGGAAYPLRYTPRTRRGVDVGLHQYDLYALSGASMDFYRLERPYTDLQFVQGSDQRDLYLTTKFSRNFADGVNFVLDYRRNSQRGRNDQYPNQNLRNTNLATGFWINHGGGKYDAFISHAANTYEQQLNGGLTELPTDGGPFSSPLSASVYLNEAFTRQSQREWMLTQYLQFGGKTDSSGRSRRAFTLAHQMRLNHLTSRVTVPFSTADSLFYQRFDTLLVDDRGLRNLIRHSAFENSFTVSTFRRGRSSNRATVQKDVLEFGLTYGLHRIRQEPRDSTVNNLMANARLGFRPSDRLRVLASGQLNLLDQAGDYRVQARGELDLGKAGKLELRFLNQLVTPTVVQQQYWLTETRFMANDFNKTLETRLEGAITLPVVDIRLGAAYNLITNYIFSDTLGLFQQTATAQNILQLTAERDLRFGNFNLTNRVLLQSTDADFIRLPSLVGEHGLFYGGKWFKVLNVNVGFDVRYFNGFRPYYYNPVVQQFQLQERQETDFFVQVDAFFSLRVTKFRFFIKSIQFNQLWNDSLLFLTAESPYPDAATRIGISWRLVD